ncbi:MAG: type II toxin-antitoxin system VapC family toxin [Nocardioides sp.]
MIAVVTNVLVYAHRSESPYHERALTELASLQQTPTSWGLPWPCVHEFLATVTNSRTFRSPTPMPVALDAIAAVARGAAMLGEAVDHLARLERLLDSSGVTGAKVHDARIAAICLSHGVTELWTADRDFSYFPELRTRNPLVG